MVHHRLELSPRCPVRNHPRVIAGVGIASAFKLPLEAQSGDKVSIHLMSGELFSKGTIIFIKELSEKKGHYTIVYEEGE